MAEVYINVISSGRGEKSGVPIHLSTGDFGKDLGGEYLREYCRLNEKLPQIPKVSKIEVIITCNK